MSKFKRSAGLSVETGRDAASFVEGHVRFVGVEGEGGSERSAGDAASKQISDVMDSLGAAVLEALLGDVLNPPDVAREKAESPSQRKRYPSEDDLSRKRSRVEEHCGASPVLGAESYGSYQASTTTHSKARPPSASPPLPEGNARYEAFCYNELIRIGGRPVVPLALLSPSSGAAAASLQAVEPWVCETDLSSGDDDVPPVFSTQLEDWMAFRQRWQWDNRGKAPGKHGFPAYLAWQRKVYLHKGELDVVASHSFEAMTRRIWDHEPAPLEVSRREGFAAYVHAVEERLTSHHFTQPFQLLKDPRRQDGWTTWVEYLNYVYWSQDRHAATMKRAERRYRRAWEQLENLDWSQSTATTTTETVDQQLSALQAKTDSVASFLRETQPYRRAEAACRRYELRAQWILEQLPLVQTAPPDLNRRRSERLRVNATAKVQSLESKTRTLKARQRTQARETRKNTHSSIR